MTVFKGHCQSSVGGQRVVKHAELGTSSCGPWTNLFIAFGPAVLHGCTPLLKYLVVGSV